MTVNKKRILILMIVLVFMLGTTASVWAGSTQAHKYSGKATHTKKWTNWGKASTKTTVFLNTKTVVTKQKQKGSEWKAGWYATTDNFHHVEGNDDLSYVKKTSIKHEISGSVNATIKAIGLEAGYSFSKTSGSDVTSKVAKNAKTGYYYFGCKAGMKDLKHITTTIKYKKKKGKWVQKSKTTSAPTGSMINSSNSNTGLYYQWVKR